MGGGGSAPRLGRFTPDNAPVPIVHEAEWAAGPVWTGAEYLPFRRKKAVPSVCIRGTKKTWKRIVGFLIEIGTKDLPTLVSIYSRHIGPLRH